MRFHLRARLVCGVVAIGAASAQADFTGQPILGTLINGGFGANSTLGKADDNDGFESGFHPFNIWDGGDDVWRINWPGGDLSVSLVSIGAGVDNDLFIYRPDSLNSSFDYSTLGVGDVDVVSIFNADPGMYYVNIDSTFFSEGGYELSVAPSPGAAAVLGLGLVGMARRRR